MENDEMYPSAGDSGEQPENPQEEKDEGRTALVPLDFLPSSLKPGDTLTIKVVHLYDDEAEISIAESKPERMSAEDDLNSMFNERS